MPAAIPIWPGIPPGYKPEFDQPLPSLTPYLIHADQPTGMVIVLPGGGYEMKADYEGKPVAEWLNDAGIAAAVLDYRVAPYRHPYPLLDARRAVQLVRNNAVEWKINPHKVAILGFSAGGHLAASSGNILDPFPGMPSNPTNRLDSHPDALVLCYPVISFIRSAHTGSMENLLGPNPSDQLRQELSADVNVSSQSPPSFIWHTADDDVVPVANALLFAQALNAHQVPFELHIFPNGPHGMALAWDNAVVGQWRALCITWLKKYGY